MRGTAKLRHQLVTQDQKHMFDYWQGLCDRLGHLPARRDIDPSQLSAQLPFITVCERTDTAGFQVRLAGTGFWNIFGAEITGRSIDDLPMGENRGYWNRVLEHVCATGLPMTGTTAPRTPNGAHLRQFWLRLPLVGRDGQKLVLGFDQFLETHTQAPSRLMRPMFGHGTPMLATA